jgi:hypothetical protein
VSCQHDAQGCEEAFFPAFLAQVVSNGPRESRRSHKSQAASAKKAGGQLTKAAA